MAASPPPGTGPPLLPGPGPAGGSLWCGRRGRPSGQSLAPLGTRGAGPRGPSRAARGAGGPGCGRLAPPAVGGVPGGPAPPPPAHVTPPPLRRLRGRAPRPRRAPRILSRAALRSPLGSAPRSAPGSPAPLAEGGAAMRLRGRGPRDAPTSSATSSSGAGDARRLAPPGRNPFVHELRLSALQKAQVGDAPRAPRPGPRAGAGMRGRGGDRAGDLGRGPAALQPLRPPRPATPHSPTARIPHPESPPSPHPRSIKPGSRHPRPEPGPALPFSLPGSPHPHF